MRKLLILIFLFCSLGLSATDYYIKNAGSDASAGTSDGAAWKTLAKLNSVTLVPGDRVYLNKGDIWYETLTVNQSGTSANNIVYSAYGTGANPIISGFQTISSWSAYSGSIYRASVSPASAPNVLFFDGVNTPLGRWPNSSSAYRWQSTDLTADAASTTGITDASLPSSPDWDGAEIVIRSAQWVTQRKTVTHNGQSLTFSALQYTPPTGAGYFIQNHLGTLDTFKEWYYASNYLYVHFGGNAPAGYTVKVSVRNNLVNMINRNYITFSNITFEGANSAAIYAEEADNITVMNCTINGGGNYGIYGNASCNNWLIRDNTISNVNNYAINLRSSPYVTIQGNTISYIGYINGMGGSSDEDYTAIVCTGNNLNVINNSISYVGYDAIRFGGQNSSITYNFINWTCLNKSDGAAIYTYRDFATGKVVSHNIVLNATPQRYGWSYYDDSSASGFYTDGAEQVTLEDNIFAHSGKGMFINSARYIYTARNLLYDNVYGMEIHSQPTEIAHSQSHTYNIYFARTASQASFYSVVTSTFDRSKCNDFGVSDYNYFVRPISNNNYIELVWYAWSGNYDEINLTEWKAESALDANSSSAPTTITSDAQLHFIYNETTANKNYTLSAPMVDHAGVSYSGTITLSTFTGKVLIGTGTVTEVGGPSIPTVSTNTVTLITENSAQSGGLVSNEGGATVTARGVCWSLNINPTIANSKTVNGSGLGGFVSTLSMLTNGTTYYVRAYATNSVGTAYGAQYSFTTSATPDPPDPVNTGLIKVGSNFVKYNGQLIIIE